MTITEEEKLGQPWKFIVDVAVWAIGAIMYVIACILYVLCYPTMLMAGKGK